MRQVIASAILFIFCLSNCPAVSGQYTAGAFYAKTYKASDGLPDTYTLCIHQDKQKYLWVGTYSGLSRFDGKTFTNFNMRNGLPDLFISAISEDAQNRIWIGTPKGLGYLLNNQYTQATTDDNLAPDFVFAFSYVIDGKLWAFTSKGLYELNGTTWVKKRPVKGYENEPCRFAAAKDNCIYYCYPSRIFKVKPNGSVSIAAAGSGANGPFFVQFRKAWERLFVTTPGGLMELTEHGLKPLFEKQLSGETIYGYYPDSKKRIWVSTDKQGLLVSAPGNDKSLDFKVPLSSNLISNFYEDDDGNMWIANFHGLVRIKRSFFDVLTPETPGMISRYFTLAGTAGSFYVFANLYGLYEYSDGVIHRKHFANGYNALDKKAAKSEVVDAICVDREKNFWVVSRDRHLLRISPAGKEELILPSGKPDTGSDVYYVAMNKKDSSIFICGKKLFVYRDKMLREFRSLQNDGSITNTWRAFPLKDGSMLVNSRTSGLWLVRLSGEAVSLSSTSGIPVSARLMVTEDQYGDIWLTYPGVGLLKYDWQNDSTLRKVAEITTKNALPNDVVEAIAVDGKNRLWAATLSGLVVIDSISTGNDKDYFIYNIGKDQGLNFVVSTGLTKLTSDVNGDIWFASSDIIARFRINELKTRTNAPVTHIESVMLNMLSTDWHKWADTLGGPFMLPRNLSLPYDQRTLTFNFKGLNLDTDDDTWYSHRLLGVDSAWMPPTKSNEFSFIRLSPGTFTFEVKSKRTNSEWSQPAHFTFTIRPPFWQTWWFRGMGIVIASLILLIIFRTQLNRVNKRAVLESQLRNLEMKALKAQMNPHFVYNALNSIQSLVIDGRQQEALDYMVKFSRLLRQVLNHSEQNVVTLEKELATLELYIHLEALRLQYTLDYSIEVNENIIPEKESIPPMILQPFVENALWHGLGEKQGAKNLSIHVYGDDDWIFCRIEDNGIGRFAGKQTNTITYQEGPRGMEITLNRLHAYNEVKDRRPVTIEDKIHPDGSAAGTTVTVSIRRK